jgi:hypothetical protein
MSLSMSAKYHDSAISEDAAGTVDVVTGVRREAALLKTSRNMRVM